MGRSYSGRKTKVSGGQRFNQALGTKVNKNSGARIQNKKSETQHFLSPVSLLYIRNPQLRPMPYALCLFRYAISAMRSPSKMAHTGMWSEGF